MRSISQRCWQRFIKRFRVKQGQLRKFELYLPYVQGKRGLEIGGPSDVFRKGNAIPVYEEMAALDNCDFSQSTVWANHTPDFIVAPGKTAGKTLFCEGSALSTVSDRAYDFVLSSHNLEHFANPVKALLEWRRVLRPGGALILVLPYYRDTFDHRRKPSRVEHMMQDYSRDIGEDDLTHLPEILERHDLTKDPAAGSMEDFRTRSLDNLRNRCLHHHVFDPRNSRELLSRNGFEVLSLELVVPPHILILARRSHREPAVVLPRSNPSNPRT